MGIGNYNGGVGGDKQVTKYFLIFPSNNTN